MFLRDPRDFHFIAICLAHGLASPARIGEVVKMLESEPEQTLGRLLAREGVLNARQYAVIVHEIIENENLAFAMAKGNIEDALAGAATVSNLDHGDAPTLLLDAHTLKLDALIDTTSGELTRYSEELNSAATHPWPTETERFDGPDSSAALTGLQSASGSLNSKSFSAALRSRQGSFEELSGTEIAGHVIEGVFGKGAFGQVYKARQRSLDRIVALKVLPPDIAENRETIDRFITEARTLATFTHPNIVQVYDVGSEGGVYYFTMEAVSGQTLKDLLRTQGRIPVTVAVNMMKQCLRGLERASRAGVIHRDIKPANLIVDDNGTVKLADFGISARVSGSGVFNSTEIVGTPLYVSPEQVRGRDVTSKADQYSLAATFYHLLTGEPPFHSSSTRELLKQHIETPPPDPCSLAPEIHPELGGVLQRMLAKEPSQRFDTFQALFKVLEDFELRHDLIESRSSFLAEGLISIGERSVRGLRTKILLGLSIGVLSTLTAIGISETLERTGHASWKVPIGNMGALLLVLSFAAIMYIAAVRKRLLPKLGNVRVWLQMHIAMALFGFVMSMVHSGNFLKYFMSPQIVAVPGHGVSPQVVSFILFLNSVLFTAVVTSGLVGRYIWRDIANQVAADRIQRGIPDGDQETHELTLSIFAQRALRYWRIFHYPMALALVAVTLMHVISILYFGGGF